MKFHMYGSFVVVCVRRKCDFICFSAFSSQFFLRVVHSYSSKNMDSLGSSASANESFVNLVTIREIIGVLFCRLWFDENNIYVMCVCVCDNECSDIGNYFLSFTKETLWKVNISKTSPTFIPTTTIAIIVKQSGLQFMQVIQIDYFGRAFTI